MIRPFTQAGINTPQSRGERKDQSENRAREIRESRDSSRLTDPRVSSLRSLRLCGVLREMRNSYVKAEDSSRPTDSDNPFCRIFFFAFSTALRCTPSHA